MLSRTHVILKDCHGETNSIKIVSGGRKAFELVLLRYLCPGVLNAAIVGSEHSIPSSKEIYSFIKDFSQNNHGGIIVIIPNIFEEVINFKLAIEKASKDDIPTKLMIVDDSCEQVGHKKPNLVGFTIALKLAGTMKEMFSDFNDIHKFLEQLKIQTVSCLLKKYFSFLGSCFENETGRVILNSDLTIVVNKMLDCLLPRDGKTSDHSLKNEKPLIILVNTNNYEEILMKDCVLEILKQLNARNQKVLRIYCGNFVFGPRGFSISLIENGCNRLINIADTCYENNTWPNLPSLSRLPSTHLHALGPYLINTKFIEIPLMFVCEALMSSREVFNKIDIDNKFGDLIYPPLDILIKMASENKISFSKPCILFNQISSVFGETMNGHHGYNLQILFSGLADSFSYYSEEVPVVQQMWEEALVHGVNFLKKFSSLKDGDLTLIDVLYPFSYYLSHHLRRVEKDLVGKLSDALNETNTILEKTYNIVLPHKKKGCPEISMQSVFAALTAIIQGIRVVMNMSINQEIYFET